MSKILLIGAGAGAASALLVVSLASGSPVSKVLCLLAPLPIMIAALGWNHWSGLVASLLAASTLGLALGFQFFLGFLVTVALPAWWLGYLALLARPVGTNGSAALEWYPVGRLLFWVAIIGALLIIIAIPTLETDKEAFQAAWREAFEYALRTQMPDASLPPQTQQRMMGIMMSLLPPMAAVLAMLFYTVNLWLAGLVTRISGRLKRPWPDLTTVALPAFAPALFALAIAGSFLSSPAGLMSLALVGSLLTAFILVGFSVLHFIVRDLSWRAAILAATYAAVLIFSLPTLGLAALLGFADAAIGIRSKVAGRRGPPAVSNDV